MGADALADVEVDDPRLDARIRVLEVDVEDGLHARQADEHAARRGKCAARQAGAGAARHHGEPGRVRDLHALCNLLGGGREHHHAWPHAVAREPVGLVGTELLWLADDRALSDHRHQLLHDGG